MRRHVFAIACTIALGLPGVSHAAEECGSVFFFWGNTDLDVPLGTNNVRLADMDGDGASDWILTRPDKIIVQLRGRDGSLRATSTFPDAAGDDLYVRQVAVADVTGDGQLDLVVRDEHSVFVVQQTSGNLALLGHLDVTPSRSPNRGPPYWKSTVVRRKALGDAV